MKMKKIISSALLAVMVFSAVACAIPVKSSAAHSPSVSTESTYTNEQIKEIVRESYTYTFNNAAEMLEYELSLGYLDYVHSSGNKFSIYVNRYSGNLYYVNNTTGEILTSNPYNIGTHTNAESVQRDLMSQVNINFFVTSNSSDNPTYTSSQWAAEYAQISVNAIKNGLRVSYTLGDTTTRFLVPGQITAERFENYILKPMLNYYENLLEEHLRESNPDAQYDLFASDKWGRYDVYKNGCINSDAIKQYLYDTKPSVNAIPGNQALVMSIRKVNESIETFYGNYVLKNPEGERESIVQGWAEYYPLTAEGIAVYDYKFPGKVEYQRTDSTTLRLYAPEYTFNDMYADEAECKYVFETVEKPVFRLALEYSFNSDGSLSVRLPANSIVFDETKYTFKTVTPLPYFGSGDATESGYVFVPDGSGSIIEYEDFKSLSLNLEVYGTDYCYSKITGKHNEQVSMPVYGMISTVNASDRMMQLTACGEKVTNGFFAILEEGASLAKLMVSMKGNDHNYVATHAQFTPYPSDEYDLSNTISVGASGSYTMVSESKYTGSYVTRYVMLSEYDGSACPPDYNGMAAYYKQYLKDTGVIEELTEIYDRLPLYIEALGSMERVENILSFPVNVKVPLTTFDDVAEMYRLLADAKNEFIKEAERLEALAEAETENITVRDSYLAEAAEYRAMSEEVYNITNVNFKLTGFANDGMYYTYPVRAKWERCLGGKNGAKELINTVKDVNKDESVNFGIYPEFDFQYINNNTLFDGIGKKNNVSKMVDNRYASKQVYNTVLGGYESFFQMVISPSALDRLYSKFLKKYSKFDFEGLSVSTLGSDLNSNFDDKNPINRDQAQGYVEELLDRMASEYSLIVNKGNVYSIKYADHIVDMCIDSSHYTYSSYVIPFTGLVLHGYVNYTGGEMNYSGTPAYDLLRSIESGAALYYTLAMQNTEFMKDDEVLKKYFGVSFTNWYFTLVEQYSELNDAIGALQAYEITKHQTLIAERKLSKSENEKVMNELKDEFVALVEKQIKRAVSDAFDSMYDDPASNGKGVKLTVDADALIAQAIALFNVTAEELEADNFDDRILELKAYYEAKYVGGEDSVTVSFSAVEYNSEYDYVTDSKATDKNYDKTEFTVDNHYVTAVTYTDVKTGDEVVFILNYNIYAVNLVIELNGEIREITLDEYGYAKIEGGEITIYG
ncbi:MAG: hypothetical protein IJF05_04050 [Clostridia bacterium]|nr:hypothetical protein [Clostridia bacterium]